jgi:hypothetical protein
MPADTLHADLLIGRLEGEDWETFGNIVGVEAGPDGAIYVLDFHAKAIRVFAPNGDYMATIGRRGEGPGEFRQPLGLLRAPNGELWVRDRGAGSVIVVSKDGHEVRRYPLPTSGSGSNEWDGVIAKAGVLRQSWGYAIQSPPGPVASGLTESRRAYYVRSVNPATGDHDSLFIAEETRRFVQFPQGRGYVSTAVPFDPQLLVAIDRSGAVWSAFTSAYRIARADLSNSARLILKSDFLGPPTTPDQRSRWQNLLNKAHVRLSPPERPRAIARIFIDDKDQLWVQRYTSPNEPVHFDVFGSRGDWIAALSLTARLAEVPAPVVRGGYLYAVTLGEYDVPQLLRAPLPPRPH